MKRRSFLKSGLVFTGLIWVPVNLNAQRFPPGALVSSKPAASGGGGCDGTSRDAEAGAFEDFVYITGGVLGYSSQFTAGGTYTICSATLLLKKVGTVSGNLTVGIYTNNAGLPNTLVGSASSPIAATTLPTTEASIDFTGMTASLSSGTIYHVVLLDSESPSGEVGVGYADEAVIAIAMNDGTWHSDYAATSRIIFQLKS